MLDTGLGRIVIEETGRWDDEAPRSEIVLIGWRDGIDPERLQSAFDACIGTGDESKFPFLRLVKKLAPELLNTNQNQEESIPRKTDEK